MPRSARKVPRFYLSQPKRKRGDSTFYINWFDGRPRRVSTATTDEVEANRQLAGIITEWNTQKRAPENFLLSHAIEHYLDARGDKISDQKKAKTRCERFIREFGDVPVSQLTVQHSRAYARKREKEGLKPASINRELSVLRAVLNLARKEGLCKDIPHIEMLPKPPPRDRWLSEEEIKRLLGACKSHHVRVFVMIALHTAARHGAIIDLLWSQVDLENRRIDFNPPGRAQNTKRRAVVPINEPLHRILSEARELASTPYVIEYNGKHVTTVNLQKQRDRAGLESFSPHVLRHTAATHMAKRGVPMELIAQMLGHTDLNMTMNTYAKYHPDFLKQAADALADLDKTCAGAN